MEMTALINDRVLIKFYEKSDIPGITREFIQSKEQRSINIKTLNGLSIAIIKGSRKGVNNEK